MIDTDYFCFQKLTLLITMGSVVPPPASDQFTSELWNFLSSLANTTGTQFEGLTGQLVRLREVLLMLKEVGKETSTESDSQNDTTGTEDVADTEEETISDSSSSTEKETEGNNSQG